MLDFKIRNPGLGSMNKKKSENREQKSEISDQESETRIEI